MGEPAQRRRKEGARMPEEKLVKTSVGLPETLWKEVRKRAIDEDRDFQDIVRDALEKYLRQHPRKEEKTR
jgi:metal-responsive CopG/Arc/MetJ family transcriptional regulator